LAEVCALAEFRSSFDCIDVLRTVRSVVLMWCRTVGSDAIMNAITDKMRELARIKDELQRQQQARDSDTLSTIVMTPPVRTEQDQFNRFDV